MFFFNKEYSILQTKFDDLENTVLPLKKNFALPGEVLYCQTCPFPLQTTFWKENWLN